MRNWDYKNALIFIVLRARFYGRTLRDRTAFWDRNGDLDNLINDSILRIFLHHPFTRSFTRQPYVRQEAYQLSESNQAICEDGRSRLRRTRSSRSIFASRRMPLILLSAWRLFTHAQLYNYDDFLEYHKLSHTATHSRTTNISKEAPVIHVTSATRTTRHSQRHDTHTVTHSHTY